MKLLNTKSIYYDDVNLLAQSCKVESRKDIPKELSRIIASPMSAIVGPTFVEAAVKCGISVCVHRFQSIEEQLSTVKNLYCDEFDNLVYFAVGLKDEDRISALLNSGVKNFIIDLANGYLNEQIEKVAKELSATGHLNKLIVGNVHTLEGYSKLAKLKKYFNGDDSDDEVIIRLNIGSGAQCITSSTTGYGRGEITTISECSSMDEGRACADGGIKGSANAVKSFGAGAEAIMLGSFFANAEEAECQVQGHKMIWGGASKKQADLLGKFLSHSEGRESDVIGEVKPLQVLIEELWGGIASGVSYSGYKTLTDFVNKGIFELKA